MRQPIIVLGIGHNTPVFMDLALDCGYEIAGLFHYNNDRTGESDHGYRIEGSFEDLLAQDLSGKRFLLTMGDNKVRTELSSKIMERGGQVPTLVHPTAVISRFATLSDIGVYVSAFSFVQADTSIGSNTIILSGVNISHTNKVGSSCFFAGGATLGAYTEVGDFVFMGQGALSISGKVKHIGHHSYIGARALLTHDVPANAVVAGSPARVIR